MYQGINYLLARQKLGLNQKEVAKKVGLKQSIISNIENGKAQKLYKELIDFYVSQGIDKNTLIQESESVELESMQLETNEVEKIKNENTSLLRENYSLAKELAEARKELSNLYKNIVMNNLKVDLGKRKASSTQKATLSKEDLNLFSLNFR